MTQLTYDNDETIYTTTIPVLVSHLNIRNHLSYDAMLTITLHATMRWLNEKGFKEGLLEGTTSFMVTEVTVNYKSEAFFDDILEIDFYISGLENKSCLFYHQITNQRTYKVVAIVETRYVFFDYQTRKVVAAPESFLKLL